MLRNDDVDVLEFGPEAQEDERNEKERDAAEGEHRKQRHQPRVARDVRLEGRDHPIHGKRKHGGRHHGGRGRHVRTHQHRSGLGVAPAGRDEWRHARHRGTLHELKAIKGMPTCARYRRSGGSSSRLLVRFGRAYEDAWLTRVAFGSSTIAKARRRARPPNPPCSCVSKKKRRGAIEEADPQTPSGAQGPRD